MYTHIRIELRQATVTTSFKWSEMARLTVELKIEWLPEVKPLTFWDLGKKKNAKKYWKVRILFYTKGFLP